MPAAPIAPQPTLARAATRPTLEMAPGAPASVQKSVARTQESIKKSPRRISSATAHRQTRNLHEATACEPNLCELTQLVPCVYEAPTSQLHMDQTRVASSSKSRASAPMSLATLTLATLFLVASAADDFRSLAARFAFESAASAAESTESTTASPLSSGSPLTPDRSSGAGSPFIWQPLPLRATFRPLNRQSSPASERPPRAPRPPRPPSPPSPPEALALTISERSTSPDASGDNALSSAAGSPPDSARFSSRDNPFSSTFFQPQPTPFEAPTPAATQPSVVVSSAPTPAPTSGASVDEDDELPTRQPMTRFRPTRAPSDDADTNPSAASTLPSGSVESGGADLSAGASNSSSGASVGMSRECFECICEASTNCNSQSRCQTSDVRHTRCGLFLISYDQWLATGLSRELVTREALQRDAAADERAFYDCVTQRECAQRLLAIYMERHRKDCDKDGRVDCYDMAAVHHSGMDQCASETLLDSQYWSDFNACLGFGR